MSMNMWGYLSSVAGNALVFGFGTNWVKVELDWGDLGIVAGTLLLTLAGAVWAISDIRDGRLTP